MKGTKATTTAASTEENKKEEMVETGRISIMPNWENTKSWLMVCKQMITKKGTGRILANIEKANKDSEKFGIIAEYAERQIAAAEKEIENLKSVLEIAKYEKVICEKKEGGN